MARAWHLKSRPQGMPTDDNFELKDVALPPLGDGTIRVRNHWLSVDPYMRGRMNDVKSYVPPFQLGEPMDGGAIGEVVESKAEGFRQATLSCTWPAGAMRRSSPPARANKLPDLGARPEQFLGVLGVTGATAYFGLLDAASAQGRRHRLRLGGRRRGRIGRRADRQGQGHDRDRLGRRRGEMRVRPLARGRPGHRLQGGAGPQGARRRRSGRHRRLFRQCRRRSSRRRIRAGAQQCAVRDLRDDRGLQQGRAARAFASSCGSSPRASA